MPTLSRVVAKPVIFLGKQSKHAYLIRTMGTERGRAVFALTEALNSATIVNESAGGLFASGTRKQIIFSQVDRYAQRNKAYETIKFSPMVEVNTNKFIEAAEKFLGKDFHISKPIKGSDLIMRSKDGLRQIRFDISNPHGLKPHINIETFEPRNLFPGDKRLNIVENLHVFPGEKLVEKKTNEQIINGIGKPSF